MRPPGFTYAMTLCSQRCLIFSKAVLFLLIRPSYKTLTDLISDHTVLQQVCPPPDWPTDCRYAITAEAPRLRCRALSGLDSSSEFFWVKNQSFSAGTYEGSRSAFKAAGWRQAWGGQWSAAYLTQVGTCSGGTGSLSLKCDLYSVWSNWMTCTEPLGSNWALL